MFRKSLPDRHGPRFTTIHLCYKECSIFKKVARKLFERLDCSHEYFDIFQVGGKKLNK